MLEFKLEYATKVYIDSDGYLIIHQTDHSPDPDDMIILSRSRARLLMEHIESIIDDDSAWAPEVDESGQES